MELNKSIPLFIRLHFEDTNSSDRIDDFQRSYDDPYDSVWLKLLTIAVYIVEILGSMIMLAFISYESQGYAGHYRTLINQLCSYFYSGVSTVVCRLVLMKYFQDCEKNIHSAEMN